MSRQPTPDLPLLTLSSSWHHRTPKIAHHEKFDKFRSSICCSTKSCETSSWSQALDRFRAAVISIEKNIAQLIAQG